MNIFKTFLFIIPFVSLSMVHTASSEELTWHHFNDGMIKAKAEKKEVIIDFYTDWCHWCKVMDEKTFNNPEVAAKLKEKFICIRINAENTTDVINFKGQQFTPVTFSSAFGVTGFPSLAFLDKEQNPITIIPGYLPPENFLPILGYMNQECYKKQISIDEYVQKQKDGTGCAETK